MGIRGLTTLLKKHCLLPKGKDNDSNGDNAGDMAHAQYVEIQPNSSLAIDGSSLAFHIVRMAYFHHYKCVKRDDRRFVDERHILLNLLPSLTPLSMIESTAKDMLLQLILKYRVNVRIYLDGKNRMFKEDTDESRADEKCRQEDNLAQFITNNILPKTFQNYNQATAEMFLQEFPLPVLWYDQVMHSFYKMEQKIKSDQVDTKLSFQIVHCPDEADRYVALASAIDVTNNTYAIGTDSDYMIYGFPMENFVVGDLSVQYVPLNCLEMGEDTLKGALLTRSHIAKTLHLSTDSLLEVSILLGNDYTKQYVQSHDHIRGTNYFHDFCETGDYLPSHDDIIDCFSETSGATYKVTSDKEDFQSAIDFSRDLFSFQNMSHYPKYVKGDSEGLHRFLACDLEFCYSVILLYVEDMMIDDDSKTTLNRQILNAFSNIDSNEDNDMDILRLFQTSLEVGDNSSDNFVIPHNMDWQSFLLSYQMEMCIKLVLKARKYKGILPSNEYSPSKLFHFGFVKQLVDIKTLKHDLKMIVNNYETESCCSVESDCSNLKSRQALPIDDFQCEILSSVKENQITVIQGETGCGKSSRVPVMLLEAPPPDPNFKKVKMFICQPRRIAAKSLTERVRSTEEHLKDAIALRMGMGVKEYESSKTRAHFCTTGYLVRLLAKHPESFNECTHVIIDEVHERSIDTDILCLLSRRLLESFPHIRLILMSATVAAELYCNYFNISQKPIFVGRRCYPIQEYFIEDISKQFKLGGKEKKIANEIQSKCLSSKCKSAPNAHYMENLHHLITQIALKVADNKSSVLIFVPGIADIVSIIENFDAVIAVGKKYTCIPVHSDIPFDEQLLAFQPAKNGEIKVIIATNAAESSVTLPDVDHVICTGLCKQLVYNEKSHRQMLTPSWISKASAMQRAGRTGRVRPGNVYRLYPKEAHDLYLAPFECGEILRSPLDTVILNLRTIVSEESISDLLLDCLEPPKVENIQRSLASLYMSGFIDTPDDDFEITAMGDLVVSLGIDSTLGALIGLGIKLGIVEAAIEIANALSSPQSVWLIPNSIIQEPRVYNDISSKTQLSMARFDAGLFSDPMSTVNLLYEFEKSKNKSAFCKRFSVSYPRVKLLLATRNNLRHRVGTVLGKSVEDLCLRKPLSQTSHLTITLLRLINIWLFHENMIELKAKPELVDKSIRVDLVGDSIIEDRHLYQLLDKNRHTFTLNTDRCIIRTGFFKSNLDEYFIDFEFNDFEERMLSAALVKDFNLIIYCHKCHNLLLYVSIHKKQKIDDFGKDMFISEQVFRYTKNEKRGRGWRERNCGEFSFERKNVDSYFEQEDSDQRALLKFCYSQDISAKSLMKLKKQLKSMANTFNILFLRVGEKGECGETSLDMQSHGSSDPLSDRDLKDMLGTPNVSLYTKENEYRQSVTLNPLPQHLVHNSESSSQEPLVEHVNEAFGILSAASSLQRYKPELLFADHPKEKTEENVDKDVDYIKISFKTTSMNGRWKQFPSGKSLFISTNNFPTTIFPVEDVKVLACCANSLLMRGDMIKVEGITVLPINELFLPLALKCIGKSYRGDADLILFPELSDLADSFFELFDECNALEYQPNAIQLLKRIFNLDGTSKKGYAKSSSSCSLADQENNDQKTNSRNLSVADNFLSKYNIRDEANDNHGLSRLADGEPGEINIAENGAINSSTKYQCPTCKKVFSSWSEVKGHMLDSHQMRNLKKKNHYLCASIKQKRKYQCPICQKMPFKWKALKKHVDDVHGKIEEKLKKTKCLMVASEDNNDAVSGVDIKKYV